MSTVGILAGTALPVAACGEKNKAYRDMAAGCCGSRLVQKITEKWLAINRKWLWAQRWDEASEIGENQTNKTLIFAPIYYLHQVILNSQRQLLAFWIHCYQSLRLIGTKSWRGRVLDRVRCASSYETNSAINSTWLWYHLNAYIRYIRAHISWASRRNLPKLPKRRFKQRHGIYHKLCIVDI